MSSLRLGRLVFGGLCGVLLALAPAVRGQVVLINEIMYHPASTNRLEQWFELFNPGPVAVDLSGWSISQGVTFVFPTNALLAAGDYLVVAADATTFASKHPTVSNFVAGWIGNLSLDGEELRLEDAAGQTVNRVAYAPEGDWAVRRIGALDPLNRQGWEWFAEHDGGGKSVELMNPQLPNDQGQNWTASTVADGTPGRPNATARSNVAPLLLEPAHFPVVPRSTDPVTLTARILDEHTTGLTVTGFWRVDGAANFTATAMADDGAHGDGLAGDGLYGAILPPHTDGTIVEFYFTARDQEGLTRTFPNVLPSGSNRTANLLYQVDNAAYAGEQPLLRLILSQAEYNYLSTQIWGGEPFSDALVNGTFISRDGVLEGGTATQVRYNCGFRNRGHGTRSAVPHNFHVAFPKDRIWKGRQGLNLNTHYTHSQQIGSAVFRRLQMPMADSRPVQVRVNGANLAKPGQEQFGSYAANEVVDGTLVQRQFPLDREGNLYRGIRDMIPGIDSEADLAWHGPSYTSYTNAYAKENNAAVNDWSDLLHLIDVLNHTADADYPAAVRQVANVDEWMKYFAVNTLLDNQENSLGIGEGDDFALYRGTNDTRFLLLPYDMDSVMGRGLRTTSYGDGLWRMTNVAAINRFVKRPEFAPLYFKHLKQLAETTFAPQEMDPLLDHLLSSYVDAATISNLKAFNANHVAYVLTQFPQTLTVSHNLTLQNGYPRSPTASVALSGSANPIDTRRVLVNGAPATYTAWQAAWTRAGVTLQPGINRVLVQALGENDVEVGRATLDVWYDDNSVQTVSGGIAANTTWTAAGGPYQVAANLTINSGVTLTIEPGTTVYLASGVDFIVANGGRLLAEGAVDAPIRFAVAPGSGVSWGGLILNGTVGSPETRIAYAHFEGNNTTCIEVAGGTLSLDHATFGTTSHQYLALDSSSFLISHCTFPTSSAGFELVHGTGGIKTGGRGIVRDCFFGATTGYNDIMDFTGGNRDKSQPILQYYNNVFVGASDDILDLDGTDAWIEGNLFLHVHRNGAPDSSAAISGGNTGSDTSEITVVGNLFYDCDNAVTAKQGNFYTLLNNTIVRTTKTGGLDFDSGVVNVRDTTPDLTTFGRGAYLEGNLIVDAEQLVRNYDPQQTTVTFRNNLLPVPWAGPGSGNSTADPLLRYIPQLAETFFTTWEEAQVLRDWFSLRPGSPAHGAGPNGRDLGGVISLGASVSGEPEGTTRQTSATLTVGLNRAGSGIPAGGFPNGSGFTHYQWRLDGGAWSTETPVSAPIQLSGLADGPHSVDVIGRNDAGWYQNDPALGINAVVTGSRVWTVDASYLPPATPTVRLNEVLARNLTTLTNLGTTPDLIELHNYGAQPVDLAGMGLTDNASVPHKFTFPAGAVLAAGEFLVLIADSATGGPYGHTGFTLQASGDDLSLYDQPANGGALLDTVRFGVQIADFSIGRLSDGNWGLCQPSFGTNNLAQLTGDPRALRINEWLADAQFVGRNDFLELYNPDPLPVALGGLFLSDAAGSSARHPIDPLSYIAGSGLSEFVADADPQQGADHLSFKLSPDVGLILLSAPDLALIDAINYGPQRTDVSEGRSPNGAATFTRFAQPTPGGGNPGAGPGGGSITTLTVPLLPLTATWRFNQTANLDGTQWYLPAYNDANWGSGPALLAVEDCGCLPAPGTKTPLTLGRMTYYFRTSFVVETNLDGFRLNLTTVLDDGAVVYLNGSRILTNGMSTGTPNYSATASRNVNNAVTEFFTLPTTALLQRTNVLAAEVHQTSSGSSDIVWGLAVDASRTLTNDTPVIAVPVVLNEALASTPSPTNPNGTTGDYLELFNPSTNAVDLSGMSLSDDSTFSRKWVFPPGSTLAAGAYRVVACDVRQPASGTNTGFGLNASGGAVFFFNTPTHQGALVDALYYGLQTPGFSLARLPDGAGAWTLGVPTPAAANVEAGLGSVSALRVNEWMVDPSSGEDWFELFNTASQPIALGGLFLTDDLANKTQSPIPPLSFLGAGANGFMKFIADNGASPGADHVKFSLKKGGEAIGLFSPNGTLLDGVRFGPQVTGVSQGRFPDGHAAVVDFATTPSPAESNYLPLTEVVVNEVLTHTDPPLEDALELFNPTSTPVNVGGWYLSNAHEDLKKYRLAEGAVVESNGFLVLYESQFGGAGGVPFTFNSAHGDAAILSQADAAGNLTGYRSEVKFGAAENGVSFGRYATSVGVDFTALSARTFGVDAPKTVAEFRTGTGLPNAYPKVGPVAITEIMYSPLTGGVENPDEEFIELLNLSGEPVALFDPATPVNTWRLRDAVDFEFPPNVTLPPDGRALVVGFDPANPALAAAFRARFAVPGTVPLFGPWNGRLENQGESVELVKPDAVQLPPHPDAGFVPQVLVDKVRYRPLAPWPTADGNGLSLQRLDARAYGNDPANWQAATPTAGRPNASELLDTDADGLADAWELEYFKTLARDGTGDFDEDGFTDLDEYLAGTHPANPADYLHLLSIATGASATLSFNAVAGRSYTVQYRESLATGAWLKLTEVPPQSISAPYTVIDAVPAEAIRFYRVVTPAQP